jgi:hypothetical protein
MKIRSGAKADVMSRGISPDEMFRHDPVKPIAAKRTLGAPAAVMVRCHCFCDFDSCSSVWNTSKRWDKP